MNQSKGTLQRLAYFLITLVITGYLLIIGKFIIVPLLFAALLSVMIQPLCNWLDRFIKWKGPVILLSFLILLLPVTGIITLFTYQLGDVIQNMPAITGNIENTIDVLFNWLNENFGITKAESWNYFKSNFLKILDAPVKFIQSGLSSSTTVLINVFMVILFMFFLLLYRKAIKNFILVQFSNHKREKGREILNQIQKLVRKYLYGLLTVILILAVLNSIGLWLIGLSYPVFWASLAALLSIIPYVGTTIGGLLPFLYAVATATFWWQPLLVIALYFTVQQIEGNLITPYVVGSNVKINPLVAIIALLIGGVFWGLSGIVLALPLIAIIKLIFDNIDGLKPVGALMGNNLHKQEQVFFNRFDEDKYRLRSMLDGNQEPSE